MSKLSKYLPSFVRSYLFTKKVVKKYLNSADFNGFGLFQPVLNQKEIENLIVKRKLDLVRGDNHPNPHIKAHQADPTDKQISKIKENGLEGCLYPTKETLETVVREKDYSDRPYTLQLALGEAQLVHRTFPVKHIETFLNDPRYEFEVSDSRGRIYLKANFEKSNEVDKIYLERFGYGFDEDKNRYVCAFLCDLAKLPPDQQIFWKGREVERDDVNLHPAFYASSILGIFPPGTSIFDAIIQEIRLINECLEQFGQPKLYKDEIETRPKAFNFLLRPTLKTYYEFVHCFDKILSDNLNHKFFKFENDWVKPVVMQKSAITDDGEKIYQNKGTLTALQEWMILNFRLKDIEHAKAHLMGPFRKVRKLRQKPAHKNDEDEFDDKYMDQQDELLFEVYTALWNIRGILERSPRRTSELKNSYDDKLVWTPNRLNRIG